MIPFSAPYIDEDVIQEVVNTLRSGWITTGKKTLEFETELQKYCNSEKVLCVNSATSALILALKWFGLKAGDEVIIPAYTYCATAHAVVHCGATPVMVDVGLDFNIDPAKIRKCITPRTKVIIPVDVAGYPADYNEIFNIVNEPEYKKIFQAENKIQENLGRILILADASHSIGAKFNNLRSGSLADLSVFSFSATKNLSTAEGGAISIRLTDGFDSEEVFKFLKINSLQGINVDALIKMQTKNWKYDVLNAGFKMNIPDVLSAIGLAQLRKYDSEILPKHKEIFEKYNGSFKAFYWAVIPPFKTEFKESSYHLYLLRVKNIDETVRNEIINMLLEKNIATNVHFLPLPMFTFYSQRGYDINNFPVSFKNYSQVISLPVHTSLTDEQIDIVTTEVINIVEKYVKKVL